MMLLEILRGSFSIYNSLSAACLLSPFSATVHCLEQKKKPICQSHQSHKKRMLFFYFYRGVAGVRVRFIRKKNHFCGYIETCLIESRQLQGNLSFGMYRYDFATKLVRKKALKLLLLQPISTIYQALVEAPGKHIHYIANLEKPWYIVVLKVFLIMLLCPVGRVYMTYSELRDTDRLIHP
ncbi:uncharacterized protein LOC126632193 isoform X3 [Malus sylvestris]|uniref:uncharacterized protein LOC126632193 isoform X3 n=1 Tax=Malus sylvestris TaxID=3752 RepID=UPI0021AC6594|nr:uncharacterized protein LOC126632193 isoform X3 [Malus sylvestris]XP_050158430.1 uncharacterized protein LOC126632193 isoform X3 [Malus sylvestris]